MFGYVMLNPDALDDDRKARFREVYCGVCTSLSKGNGGMCRLALSFDCAFLALLLNALYEPEETKGAARCAAHPARKQKYAISPMTEYAADINVLLFYLSALDGWMDDRNGFKYLVSKAYKKHAEAVERAYPGKVKVIRRELQALGALEKERVNDLDAPAGCFGRLLGEVFAYREDEWAQTLRTMGCALGRFIYLMDAWDDCDRDIKKRAYNPLAFFRRDADYEKRVYDILTMEIAECAMAFEKLPIVQDADILRNILYSGVWMKYSRKKETRDRKGKTV